jgi:glycine/D-amino acid oxidase-like deaminating enzyme
MPSTASSSRILSSPAAALSWAEPKVLWLDDPEAPEPLADPAGDLSCDLAVIGGGFTGLWTALLAKERQPDAEVVLLEADRVAIGASGRNGGFCDPSLTHGLLNGLSRFPAEIEALERLGGENFDALAADVERLGIDCAWEPTGHLAVATEAWQLGGIREEVDADRKLGGSAEILTGSETQAAVHSPTYKGGARFGERAAIVNPAKLAWGLGSACAKAGVTVREQAPVVDLRSDRSRIRLRTPLGRVSARRVAIATNAFPPLLRRIRLYTLPVYDYVLATEPLDDSQLAAIGWSGREGISDSGNQFHYYRLTADRRIVWGGYDAIYHFGNGVRADLEQRPKTFAKLASHFFETFPQLDGLKFTHRWGGAIDTSSRFSPLWGLAHSGRVTYCVGFTGLGVVASRFGARVMLDLLDRRPTELTRLGMVREKPLPFPPEPARSAVVGLTRWSLARADRRDGRRNAWLRLLDRLGLGFDS